MIYLIDGADGTGKSTLARALSERLPGAPVLHYAAPEAEDAVTEYVVPVMRAQVEHRSRDVICDRSFLGELVWPALFGRPGIVRGAFGVQQLLTSYRRLGGFRLVVLERAEAGIVSELTERGEGNQLVTVLRSVPLFREAVKLYNIPATFTNLEVALSDEWITSWVSASQ